MLVGFLLAALGTGDVVSVARAAPADNVRSADQHKRFVATKHRTTVLSKARIRTQLTRQLRKNPLLALNRSFLRKADFVDFSMPLTVRLTRTRQLESDDRLQIDWNTDTQAWPLPTTTYAPTVQQTVSLTGRFSMEWHFGSDTTGYTTLGTSETTVGSLVDMVASPLLPATTVPISDFATPPACAATDQPALAAVERPTGLAFAPGLKVSGAGSRFGTINPFGGSVRGNLNLYFSFRSSVRSACGAVPAMTKVIEPAAGGDPTAPGAGRPVPVSFTGDIHISPGITEDGQLKLGHIVVDDAVTPQTSTFGQIYSCTLPNLGPASSTCAPGDGDAQPFPSRVKITKLTAELLIGDVPG